MGQHFLRCEWVISTLIHAANLTKDDIVLEVGPGEGVLTRALAARAKKVIAVEKDEKLAMELKGSLAQEKIPNIEIIAGDILQALPVLVSSYNLRHTTYKLISNIPYYLTSRLLRILLENEPRPKTIVLTIQKEVAQRIAAKPPNMNLLALSVQAFGTPEIIKNVPASCFFPKPKVDSVIIKISDISENFFLRHRIKDKEFFFSVVRSAFGQKRKYILNSLGGRIGKKKVGERMQTARIPQKARPQELTLAQWVTFVKMIISNRPTA